MWFQNRRAKWRRKQRTQEEENGNETSAGSGQEECPGGAGQDEDVQPQETIVKEIDENVDVEYEVDAENQRETRSSPDDSRVIKNESGFEIDARHQGMMGTLPEENLSYNDLGKDSLLEKYSQGEERDINLSQKFSYEGRSEVHSSTNQFEAVGRSSYHPQPSMAHMFYPTYFDVLSNLKSGTHAQSVIRKQDELCAPTSRTGCSCCRKYHP